MPVCCVLSPYHSLAVSLTGGKIENINETGMLFGRLTVLKEVESSGYSRRYLCKEFQFAVSLCGVAFQYCVGGVAY